MPVLSAPVSLCRGIASSFSRSRRLGQVVLDGLQLFERGLEVFDDLGGEESGA